MPWVEQLHDRPATIPSGQRSRERDDIGQRCASDDGRRRLVGRQAEPRIFGGRLKAGVKLDGAAGSRAWNKREEGQEQTDPRGWAREPS